MEVAGWFIGAGIGTVFTALYDGVEKLMGRTTKFKAQLEALKLTLKSFDLEVIQQIGKHNQALGIPNKDVEALEQELNKGVRIICELADTHLWNRIDSRYINKLVQLNNSLNVLERRVKMQSVRDIKETRHIVEILLRQTFQQEPCRDIGSFGCGSLLSTSRLLEINAPQEAIHHMMLTLDPVSNIASTGTQQIPARRLLDINAPQEEICHMPLNMDPVSNIASTSTVLQQIHGNGEIQAEAIVPSRPKLRLPMAEPIVSFVVERVGDFIIQEGRSLAGVGDQVRRAHTDLFFIKGFLKDVSARQRDIEAIRIFVANTRDVAYDLEEVMKTFVLKVDSKRTKGGIKSVLRRLGCTFIEGVCPYKIGSDIGDIMSTISDLRTSLQSFIIREISESGGWSTSLQLHERQQQLGRTYSRVVQRHNVVELDDITYELVMRLTKDEHRHHRVVSIWGVGGLGKTTLAKQVYHHKEVMDHFDCFAWVSLSQQYQVRDVLERIYLKLICATTKEREEITRLKDDELVGRLTRVQNERKCLIVLDDIRKMETWDFLKSAFEFDEKSQSRILLTTRNEKVALYADVNGFCYQPPRLSETKSWELFEKIAMCGRDDSIDKEVYTKMKKLGKKMLVHCAGLPLAITVLGGLLAKENIVCDWNTIFDYVCDYINRSMNFYEEEQAIASWALVWSYNDLPSRLKPCFLYLGLFPKGYEIRVKTLIRLWIAEGFIFLAQQRQNLGKTMEDVAYNWFGELVERCMVQVVEYSSTFGTIKSCKMHDRMRDFCLLHAEEKNFFQVVTMHPFSSSTVNKASSMGKIRRLTTYLHENDVEFVRVAHPRSLLCFGPNEFNLITKSIEEILPSMFMNFKVLRVLKIEGVKLQGEEELQLPSTIGKMYHLRFLSLRNSGIKSFPPFLGNLIVLQTLDFRVRNDEMVIPNVIWKMNCLRHLYLPRIYKASGKLQLSTLGDLQTLDSVLSGCCDLNDLSKLRHLRKLRIRLESEPWKNLEKILEAAGSVLNGIRSLELVNDVGMESGAEEVMQQLVARCGQIYKLTVIGPMLELPKEFHSYSNLTKLFLEGCGLKDDQMAKLEKLPNLKSLELWEDVFDENTKLLVFSNGSFPRLQFLSFGWLKGIREWRVEKGAIPSLCRLVINHCWELSRVPDGLRHLTTLKELTIERMPREFCNMVEEGGEDFHKIQHIPSIVIQNQY